MKMLICIELEFDNDDQTKADALADEISKMLEASDVSSDMQSWIED